LDTMRNDALADVPGPDRPDEPAILEEIEVEDLAVDGICGVY
jgi:mycofactocin precursor